MSITKYNEVYSLLKENEVVQIEYDKRPTPIGIINVNATLKKELIPDSDDDLKNYDITITTGEWSLSGDSDGTLDSKVWSAIEASTQNGSYVYPNWIKVYSTNYNDWVNININKIISTTVVS